MPTNSSNAIARSTPSRSSRWWRGNRSSAPSTPVRWRASVPTTTFSSAVISPKSLMFWKVLAMPRRVICDFLSRPRGRPSSSTSPEEGR